MSKINKLIYFSISTLFFILLDVYFTAMALNAAKTGFQMGAFINLIPLENTGAAFNLLENARPFLIAFSIFAIIVIVVYLLKNIEKISTLQIFWTAMLMSGICCNLYERITLGHVRDFFSLNFVNFPVFNISDIFINIGVAALIIIIIKNNYLKNENNH